MKITENADRRLVIEHRPWLLAGMVWLMGLAALYTGITEGYTDSIVERVIVLAVGAGVTFAAWYWFAFLRITFDRDDGKVEHRTPRPIGSRSKYL